MAALRRRDACAYNRKKRDQGEEDRNDGFHGLFRFVLVELDVKMRTRPKCFQWMNRNIFKAKRNSSATS
jgi:hypothetical protein